LIVQFHETGLSFGGGIRARARRRVFLNVTSLVDVLFMMLTFFVVSTTFIEQPGMKLDLPAAKSAEISRVEALVLNLYQDGSMSLNGQLIALDRLREALQAGLPKAPEGALNLFADKNVTHGKVIEVMDLARQAGIKKLVVATLTEK
jgi:biopolymer transport protein ExbD